MGVLHDSAKAALEVYTGIDKSAASIGEMLEASEQVGQLTKAAHVFADQMGTLGGASAAALDGFVGVDKSAVVIRLMTSEARELTRAVDVFGDQMNLLRASGGAAIDAYCGFDNAALAIRQMVEELRGTHGFIGGLALDTHIEQMRSLFQFPELISASLTAVHDHFHNSAARIADILASHQSVLAVTGLDSIGRLMTGYESTLLSATSWAAMTGTFGALHDAYNEMLKDPVAVQLAFVADLRLPERDVRLHAAVVDSFSGPETLNGEVLTETPVALASGTIERIGRFSPRLAGKLASAARNLSSDDPQVASNACLAIRQILFAILNKLAPEAKVLPWARQHCPELVMKDDRPQHEARLLYISRFDLAEQSAFTNFIRANCKSLTALLKVLQKVIHDESSDGPPTVMTPIQVTLIVVRAASAFDELLLCAEAQEAIQRRSN